MPHSRVVKVLTGGGGPCSWWRIFGIVCYNCCQTVLNAGRVIIYCSAAFTVLLNLYTTYRARCLFVPFSFDTLVSNIACGLLDM